MRFESVRAKQVQAHAEEDSGLRVRRTSASSARGWRNFGAAIAVALIVLARQVGVAQTLVSPLRMPAALAYDASGNLYIADANRNQVLEATLDGTLIVVAGTGMQGFSGDGGPATAAELNSPQGLAVGADGTLYISDTGNSRIRRVAGGIIATFAGNGVSGFNGDGVAAGAAEFRSPTALAVDVTGALLVCDSGDHRVRRIADDVVATLAGDGVQGFSGDGSVASEAELDSPAGIAVAADGRVFIADSHNQRVRVISPDGMISTFAGTGQRGFAGDGGPAIAAQLSGPRGLSVDGSGGLVIADAGNGRIRTVSATGVITSVAGSGLAGSVSDGGSASQAPLRGPRWLATSPAGLPALGDALSGWIWVLAPGGSLYAPAALLPGARISTLKAVPAVTQVYGQVAFSATVNGFVGVPQGTVTVSEAGVSLTSGALSNGTVNLGLPGLSAGSHSITVSYGGDGLNPGASAAPAPVEVTPAPVLATANPASVAFGASVPALSGVVSGVLPQDAGQVSVVFGADLPNPARAGTYPITASLTGARSSNYAVSLGPGSGSLEITQAASEVALAPVSQSYAGLPIRLYASVASTTSGQPSGTVQFLDGGTVIASAAIVSGKASGVYVSPPAGARAITAQYVGDGNFAPSTSAAELVNVGQIPDFGVTTTGASTATIPAGSTASYALQVQAAPSPFTGVVVFSATGLPSGAVATFSPAQVVPGAGSATVMVNIQTASQIASKGTWRAVRPTIWAGFTLFFVAFSCRRRKKLLWVCGVSLWICGCGARTVGEGSRGVTTQSYPIQIRGTSTNLLGSVVTHDTSLTLILQQ